MNWPSVNACQQGDKGWDCVSGGLQEYSLIAECSYNVNVCVYLLFRRACPQGFSGGLFIA